MTRVGSYNVHGFVGRDGRRDVERTATVIAELDCDAVGLQEVDSRGHPSTLAELEQRTGMRAVPGVTMSTPTGDYGNVLLTSCTVLDVDRHDLSVEGREPRGALGAVLEAGDGSVFRMVVTHLGLRRSERRIQLERLLPILDRRDERGPLVLVGDLNEWRPASSVLSRLRRVFGRSTAPRTFPASRPMLPLDRIWVRPSEALVDLRAHRSTLARQASDHLPLVATMDLAEVKPEPVPVE